MLSLCQVMEDRMPSTPTEPRAVEHHGKRVWTSRWYGDVIEADGRRKRPRYAKRFGEVGKVTERQARATWTAWLSEWQRDPKLQNPQAEPEGLLVQDLAQSYLDHACTIYRKGGKLTSHVHNIRAALQSLVDAYGARPIDDFSAPDLATVRDAMIAGASGARARGTVNKRLDIIRRAFAWGVEKGVVAPTTWHGLCAVGRLLKGRSEAKEQKLVRPIHRSVVEATLPHCGPVVRAMIEVQWFTGMRPDEVCIMRGCDLDQSGKVWLYRPDSHKLDHLDEARPRVIAIGQRAQQILKPYLQRDLKAYLFSPTEAEVQRLEALHAARQTPLSCGNRPGTNRAEDPEKRPGDRYTSASYRRAIHRACDRAFPPTADHLHELAAKMPPAVAQANSAAQKRWLREQLEPWYSEHRWSPNQLRHAFATRVRKVADLETASASLGHTRMSTTEIYAEQDLERAIRIARRVG